MKTPEHDPFPGEDEMSTEAAGVFLERAVEKLEDIHLVARVVYGTDPDQLGPNPYS